jgi:hypothetical protein
LLPLKDLAWLATLVNLANLALALNLSNLNTPSPLNIPQVDRLH